MDGLLRLHTQRCTWEEKGLRKDSFIRWDGAEQEKKLRNEYICMQKKKKCDHSHIRSTKEQLRLNLGEGL